MRAGRGRAKFSQCGMPPGVVRLETSSHRHDDTSTAAGHAKTKAPGGRHSPPGSAAGWPRAPQFRLRQVAAGLSGRAGRAAGFAHPDQDRRREGGRRGWGRGPEAGWSSPVLPALRTCRVGAGSTPIRHCVTCRERENIMTSLIIVAGLLVAGFFLVLLTRWQNGRTGSGGGCGCGHEHARAEPDGHESHDKGAGGCCGGKS